MKHVFASSLRAKHDGDYRIAARLRYINSKNVLCAQEAFLPGPAESWRVPSNHHVAFEDGIDPLLFLVDAKALWDLRLSVWEVDKQDDWYEKIGRLLGDESNAKAIKSAAESFGLPSVAGSIGAGLWNAAMKLLAQDGSKKVVDDLKPIQLRGDVSEVICSQNGIELIIGIGEFDPDAG